MSRMRTVFTGLLVSSAAVAAVFATSPASRVVEEVLGEISVGIDPDDVRPTVSSDGQKVAWEERQGKRSTVRLNGVVQGTAHDEVDLIQFSLHGERFAYAARDGKAWQVFADGTAPSAHEKVMGLSLSRDGRRVAYGAKKDGKWLIVQDGVGGRAYDEVGAPIFSPDGARVIYPAKRNKKWVVVENGEERGPEMAEIWLGRSHMDGYIVSGLPWAFFPSLSEDGATLDPNRFAYYAQVKDGWVPVVAGREQGPAFEVVAWPTFFGAQSERVVYAGARVVTLYGRGEKATGQIVIDGVAGQPREGEPTETAGSGLLKALGGAPPKGIDRGVQLGLNARAHGVSSPAVSKDRLHLAYASRRGANDYVVVRDDVAGPRFDRISCGPQFGANGAVFYVGLSGDTLVLMANDARLGEVVWKGADCTGLSLAGEHAVFVASDGDSTYRVFMDGRQLAEYRADRLGSVRTSLAGETLHLAYQVTQQDASGKASSFVVLDGAEGNRYDTILAPGPELSPGGAVTYVARRGRQFVRVTQIPET